MSHLTKESKQIGQADFALIKEAKSVVFFGGAGVSTESGVPDFRSANGIYAKVQGAESILTPRFMTREPEAFYDFYRTYFMAENIQPNRCHRLLATLEQAGQLDWTITQNVDGLHQKAGSQRVLELHGSGHHFHCVDCHQAYKLDQIRTLPKVPRCTCGGLIRPDIVLYEEGLDDHTMTKAIRAIEHADLLIIGGTSLTVYPAAGLVHLQKRQGEKILIDQAAKPFPGVDVHRPMQLGHWSETIEYAMRSCD